MGLIDPHDPHDGPLPGAEIEKIKNLCLDAEGYVIFAGVLSNKRGPDNKRQIDWHYRRSCFTFEDAKSAVSTFGEFVKADLLK